MRILSAALQLTLVVGLVACSSSDQEKAKEEAHRAAQKASEEAKKAGQEIKNEAKDLKRQVDAKVDPVMDQPPIKWLTLEKRREMPLQRPRCIWIMQPCSRG